MKKWKEKIAYKRKQCRTINNSTERSYSEATIKVSKKVNFYNELSQDPKYQKLIDLKEETENEIQKTVGAKGSSSFIKSLVSRKKARFGNWLLYKRMGWTAEVTEDHPDKFIICLAPHTSNWDFLIGQLYIGAKGMQSNFLMKKEWFFWPFGILFRRMGGIPVHRQK